jgi:hypothetical protein
MQKSLSSVGMLITWIRLGSPESRVSAREGCSGNCSFHHYTGRNHPLHQDSVVEPPPVGTAAHIGAGRDSGWWNYATYIAPPGGFQSIWTLDLWVHGRAGL